MAGSKKTREMMECVSHQQVRQLLHNKFIVVLGDSIQRSVYKDLVLLLQKEKYLTLQQLRSKGEMSFEMDCLVEGGFLSQLHNGTDYREVRQFQSDHHLVRFYFVTRIFSRYMQSILDDFHNGLKPDVVIVNSCVWDISRYKSNWVDDYKENLRTFFNKLSGILPEETLVMWSLTMPLAERIKGGFLVPEIEHIAPHLRYDVIEANFCSGTLANAYGIDVLDLHYQFRFSQQHRTKDGVHWNALAHRRITSLLLQHAAQAWGVNMPCQLTTVEHTEVTVPQPVYGKASNPAGTTSGVCHAGYAPNYCCPAPTNYFSSIERNYQSYREEFSNNSLPLHCYNFEDNHQQQRTYRHRPALPPQFHRESVHRRKYDQHGQGGNGFHYRPHHSHDRYNEHHHQYVMKSRRSRHHFAPYAHHRPDHYPRHGSYY
nr:PREDICTED: PC-esterase domain-containing protein 1A-like isoform X1 [Paralichthys olivaceus]